MFDSMTEEEAAAYDAYVSREEARGELCGAPEKMPCPDCTKAAGRSWNFNAEYLNEQRSVVKMGPVVEAHRDPTATYVLSCGHTVI